MDEVLVENEYARLLLSPLAGASLRSLRVVSSSGRTHELLVGGDGPHNPSVLPQGTGSFIMCPWPSNMLEGVLYANDRTYKMPVNRPPNAIHGLTRDREWCVVDLQDTSARLTTELSDPWPFQGDVTLDVELQNRSLTMALSISAGKEHRFPVGVGWHPWFRPDLGDGRLQLHMPGQLSVWEIEQHATGCNIEVEDHLNLLDKTVPLFGEFNHCFDVQPDYPVNISWPGSLDLQMWSSNNVSKVVVYTPEHAVCVEPVSCTVDAFRLDSQGVSNTGTVYVDRDHPFSAWTRWEWQ